MEPDAMRNIENLHVNIISRKEAFHEPVRFHRVSISARKTGTLFLRERLLTLVRSCLLTFSLAPSIVAFLSFVSEARMTLREPAQLTFDFRNTLNKNRIKGLWSIMADYRLPYIGATAALAVSALSKTFTYLLLRFFVDDVLAQKKFIGGDLGRTLGLIAAAFIGLAALEGSFAFLSGRLAARRRDQSPRDFLFDHIQRLSFSYHATTPTGDLIERVTSDVDALRRFFSEGIGGDASCCCF
jgi:ABC-type bacteriocin/lantibiotic exporter with double-glycine peptidase domain